MEVGITARSPAIWRTLEWVVVVAAAVFVALGTRPGFSKGDSANSRLSTVVALVHDGTWYIDRPKGEPPNPYEQRTIDKVRVGDRLISSKPPVLTLLMTGEYLLLHNLFALDLREEHDTDTVLRVLALTLAGAPYLLILIFFRKALRLFGLGHAAVAVSLAALAFGTQIGPYATLINNHVPAACGVMIALYLALGLGGGQLEPKRWRFAAFGLCGGLACTIDVPSGIFILFAAIYLLSRFPRETLVWAAAGAAMPLAVHFGVLLAITGSPLPVQMHKEWYLYETSYWRNPRGVDALNEPKGTYLFHMTFGRSGLFSLYPVTLLAAFAWALRRPAPLAPAGALLWVGTAGFAVLTAYYVFSTNNYGGASYGFRWYIVTVPVLMLMSALVIARVRRHWQRVLVGLLLAVSMYSALECSRHPWRADASWTTQILGDSL